MSLFKIMNKLIIVTGPTASGKTDYSLELAKSLSSPIVSCDSRQIYKELKIGTAPPTAEQLNEVKHYFIYSHSIFNHYTAGKYELEALALLSDLFKKHESVVMAGGSGLYIDALLYGIDDFPAADMKIRESLTLRLQSEGLESLVEELTKLDPRSTEIVKLDNPRRVLRALEVCLQTGQEYSSFLKSQTKKREFETEIRYIDRDREQLYQRINSRVDIMIEEGLVEEAKALYPHKNLTALNTVGYKEFFAHFDGEYPLETAIDLIKRDTRRFAKRQITWWREREKIIIKK